MKTPWQGTWVTTFNELRLHQRENRVYGDYQNIGLIEGKLDPSTNILEGIYVNGTSQGRIRFTLNGDQFEGKWAGGNAEPSNVWVGTRTSTAKPELTSHPFIGIWKTSQGELKLRQEGTNVYGKLNDDIDIEGTFTFTNKSVLGTYKGPNTSGRFQITAANNTFQGDWEASGGRVQSWTGEKVSSAEPDFETDNGFYQLRVGEWSDPKQLIDALASANIQLKLSPQQLNSLLKTGGILAENLSKSQAEAIQSVLAKATLDDLLVEIVPMPTSTDTNKDTMSFAIQGRIAQNSRPIAGITIRAYDRDLRTEQLLGSATTDTNGRYEITYTSDQFRRADKTNADLDLRLFNPAGTQLDFEADRPLPIFNADPEVEIDLTLRPKTIVNPSEYENLRLIVDPILEGTPPSSLTAIEIDFIANDTNIATLNQFPFGIDSLSLLRASDRLSQSTNIPTAAFYGWGRFNNTDWNTREDNLQSIDLDPLIDADLDNLQRLFTGAIDENWIPQTLRDRWDEIRDRLNALKANIDEQIRQTWDVQVASIRLVDEATNTPLLGYTVRAQVDGRELPPIDVSSDITNENGIASFEYRLPPDLVSANAESQIQFDAFPIQADGTLASSPTISTTVSYRPRFTDAIDIPVELLPESDPSPRDDDGDNAPKPNALSPNAYLADLMRYIITHFETLDGQPLTIDSLETLLHQSLEPLPRSIAAASDPIHQNRIALESLLTHLQRTSLSPEQTTILNTAQQNYLKAVYQSILFALGTTPDELIRSRYLTETEQTQLDERLGIRQWQLDTSSQAQTLLVEATSLSVDNLDRLFGLRTPFSDRTPELLELQATSLKQRWLQRDFPDDSDSTPAPIIDPDLLTAANILSNTAAITLFQTRTQTLSTWMAEASNQPRTEAGFTALLTQLGLTSTELTTNFTKARNGDDISAYLSGQFLLISEFLYLHNIWQLLESGTPPLSSEWEGLYHLVVQVRKRRSFMAWQDVEKQQQISLSPDFFQLTDEDLGDRLDVTPAFKWRLNLARRRTWEQTLRTRITQLTGLETALAKAVSDADASNLSIWRDGVIAAASRDNEAADRAADRLSEVLLIDLKTGGDQSTTRVSQALQSLQTLCFATQTGQLDTPVIQFKGEVQTFNTDWQWVGSYETWKAAMAAYLYPENIVFPTIQEHQSPAYQKLVQKIRNRNSLTPVYAKQLAQEYEDYFRDICDLEILATCEATTGDRSKYNISANTKLTFLFAKSKNSGNYYWSTYLPSTESNEQQLSLWKDINQAPEKEFIGASSSGWDKESQSYRHICLLFKHYSTNDGNSLQILRLNLQNLQWEDEQPYATLEQQRNDQKIVISLKEIAPTGDYSAVVIQGKASENKNVLLLIKTKNNLYLCSLDNSSTNFNYVSGSIKVAASRESEHILSATKQEKESRLYIIQGSDNTATEIGYILVDQFGKHLENRYEKVADLYLYAPFAGIITGFSGKFLCFDSQYNFKIVNTNNNEVSDLKKATYKGSIVSGKSLSISSFDKSGKIRFFTTSSGPISGELIEFNYQFIFDKSLAPEKVEFFEPLTLNLHGGEISQRKKIPELCKTYLKNESTNRIYIEEAYYFVPLFIAESLRRNGYYYSSLEIYRNSLYDFSVDRSAYRSLLSYLTGFGRLINLSIGNDKPMELGDDWLNDAQSPHKIAQQRKRIYFLFSLYSLLECLLEYADSEFSRDTPESLEIARILYDTALEIIELENLRVDPEDLKYLSIVVASDTSFEKNYNFEISPNIIFESLFQRATVNLGKLRMGRNIAGIIRKTQTYYVESSQASLIRFSGSPAILKSIRLQPTQYRYRVLIDRSKELINLAQQIESSYLSALQYLDGENYNLLKAKQDIALIQSGIKLQDLRVQQAEGEVVIARLQKEQSEIQFNHYDRLITIGILSEEKAAVDDLKIAASLQVAASFASFIDLSASDVFSSAASALTSRSSEKSTQASYIRRNQEWKLQRQLANKNIQIGRQQNRNAQNSVRIIEQERAISELDLQQAEGNLNFLSTKNLTAELYAWMSNVLRRVYIYFLQEATAIAHLAEQQLAFERQISTNDIIQADYLKTPTEISSLSPVVNDNNYERLGLTGSAQLLQDIYQLDQLSFRTNQRKLQLTKIVSLARLFPIEFAQFRESGILPFETSLELFDRDYPGHYLRLIEQIKVSVIALIPPTEGIKATLKSIGESQVITGDAGFPTEYVKSSGQLVAFSSPNNDSGLFELQQQSEFLRPFEKQGVASQWNFELPKASNPFDFSTIADVLLTIEYTALHSEEYKNQILSSLDCSAGGDTYYSIRNQFADAWYDLHNPDQTETPGTVSFNLRRADFPPNIEGLSLGNVRFVVSMRSGKSLPDTPIALTVSTSSLQSETKTLNDTDPVKFPTLQGLDPNSEWTLSLPENRLSELFDGDTVEDIFLVVGYEGMLSEYPTSQP